MQPGSSRNLISTRSGRASTHHEFKDLDLHAILETISQAETTKQDALKQHPTLHILCFLRSVLGQSYKEITWMVRIDRLPS